MKFEDLFKYYMSGDNPEDNIYNPDGDPDDEELDPEDEDGGDSGDGSSIDSEDSYDDYQDYDENGEGSGEEGSGEDGETNYAVGEDGEEDQEDQDQDDSNNRNNRDKKDKDEDDTGKEKDTNPTDENGEDGTKTEAGKDQENLDNVDKNLDEKDTENKLKEAKEQEADGSKGHTSSDTGAKNPLEETDAGGLGNEGPQGAGDSPKGAGDSPKGSAGDSPTGGPKGGAGDSPAGGPKGGGAGAEQAGKEVGKEAGKGVADASAKAGGEVAKDAALAEGTKDAAIGGGTTAAAGTGTAAAAGGGTAAAAGGGGAAASGAGGGGLISLIGATVPWSLIVIAVIIIIIIIIIIISFFQTLPGSMLENLKTSVKKWFSNFFAEVAESLGFSDNSLRVNGDDVNRLAQYINDMGYDIQTYGFGDIIVKSEDKGKEGQRDDRAANGVDKKVEDDGESEEIKCKSKYLKAYLAADECTYHFRSFNILNTLFSSSTAQLGLIEVKDDGGWFNQYRDKLKIDRTNEDLIIYNNSLDIPVIGWFKKLFTGTRAFQWGEMFRYDLNTWIGRYKRPVELFLAIHLSTMMPDLTYRIATEQRFNTEVDVRFEPIKVSIRGELKNSGETNAAYIVVNGEKKYVIDIIRDYFSLFEIYKGWFDSQASVDADTTTWQNWTAKNTTELWYVFDKLFDKFHDESTLDKIWNFFVDWKTITLENERQVLIDDDLWCDDEINFESRSQYAGFYSKFGCDYQHLADSNIWDKSGDFELDDLIDMIDKWNEDNEFEDGDEGFLKLDDGWADDVNDLKIAYVDTRIKLKLKDSLKGLESTKEKITLAFIVYKMATEDIMNRGDGGIDGVLWPFVEQVKNHWYYKDIDFLGTTTENATYRLAKVGYKTIEYKNEVDGVQYNMQIPGVLYPDTSDDWDFIVYQVAEPVTEGCNDAIKDVFSGQYYRYDGTVEKAMAIANSRALEEGKSKYYYGGTDYTVEDKEKSKAVKEVVSMPDSPEQTLQSLAILKNMHSVSSDYIYRDLKELYVKLEYYSKEQMTEDLTLMWLWPIKVDNKNATFDLVETHDKFGKSIVAWQNAEVLSPCDGTLAKEDDSYEITVTTLNDDAEKLLQYIFRNDYYRINKTKLNGLKIRLDGLTLDSDVHVGDSLKRGQTIGKVNNAAGKLNVTIRFADKTVVDDMTEYMREDHNNKYEEIMKRKMECEEGSLPPIPLRSIFGYSDGGSGPDVSVDGYSKNPETVSASANAKAIYQGLQSNFSAEQLAAALGNVHFESGGLKTNNLQDTYETAFGETDESYTNKVNAGTWVSPGGNNFIHDSAGYGLAQWTYYSRKESLYNKHTNSGKSIDNIDIQVELLREEMVVAGNWADASYKSSFDNCGTGEDAVMVATKAYCYGYEAPETPEDSMQRRINLALGYYRLITNKELDS